MQVPFIELHGESTEYVGRAEDAIIALSNYRLHIKFKESVVNVSVLISMGITEFGIRVQRSLPFKNEKSFFDVQNNFSGTINVYLGTKG